MLTRNFRISPSKSVSANDMKNGAFFSERETFQCGLASSSNSDLIIIVVVIIIITIFIIVITIIIVIITIIIIVIKSDVSERRPDHQTPEQR